MFDICVAIVLLHELEKEKESQRQRYYIFDFQLCNIHKKKYFSKAAKIQLRSLRDTLNPFQVSESSFKKSYRMNQTIALILIDLLKPHDLHPWSDIPFYLRVLAAINFFATGSYQNPVGHNKYINVSQASVSRAIDAVCELVIRQLRHYIKFPTTVVEKNRIKGEFQEKFGISNTIGAIDCCHIAIIAPPQGDAEKPPRLYRNRKRFYSINVEAVI